jgi:N-sulfoglucosamine sulfohydrolase
LPLIVNWPSTMTGGKSDDRLVSSIDVAASILEVAGIDLPDYMTAQPFINNNNPGREYVYSARDLWDEILEQSRAITTKDFRYIKNDITDQSYDAHQAYLEFYRPAVHIMRGLKEKGELDELQSKFFAPTKEKEELYDLKNDPFETRNLANKPEYAEVLTKMKGYYKDWNSRNHDYGFEEINWENSPPPNAPEVIKWLQKERPEVLEQMKQGVEPGFGTLNKAYKNQYKNK